MAAADRHNLATSKGHQWLALIGATFIIFEIVFIGFYSNNFWFSLNLALYGVPAILVVAFATHFLLRLGQSRLACRLVFPLLRGKPPIVYMRWLTLDETGFVHGMRHICWEAVEKAELTFFGNLEIKSRVLCGDAQPEPDVLFKFPFSVAAQNEQRQFVDALKAARPAVVVNQRLEKRLNSPVVKGQNLVQALGGAMMFVLLLDLGFSSFYYLDMLKHYYLANVDALDGRLTDAQRDLDDADRAHNHPLPISYVTTRLLSMSSCAAELSNARADALWHMGRKQDALAEGRKLLEFTPDNFRAHLHYARLLEETGDGKGAREQIEKVRDKHKDWLLPRLYLMANVKDNQPDQVPQLYRQTMSDLTEQLFSNEPAWPPGGQSFVHDLFYSHDLYFVFNRLLGVPIDPNQKPAGAVLSPPNGPKNF